MIRSPKSFFASTVRNRSAKPALAMNADTDRGNSEFAYQKSFVKLDGVPVFSRAEVYDIGETDR